MEEAARLFLALIVLALLLNLILHGRGGVTDWLAAKFLGKPPAAGRRRRIGQLRPEPEAEESG